MMKILDRLNVADNKCQYCTFKQSKDWPWQFVGKQRGVAWDHAAQLEYDSDDQKDNPGITLNAWTEGSWASTQIFYCPFCGRKLGTEND